VPDNSATLIVVQAVVVMTLTGLHGRLMLASNSSTLDLPLN
jgi:hypothetical protein